MTKKKSRPSETVSKEVYDICAGQRDHWKEMYDLASQENAKLRERNRLLQRRDDYVTGCLV